LLVADTKKIKELKAKHAQIIQKENKKIENVIFDFTNSLMEYVGKNEDLSKELIAFFDNKKLTNLKNKYKKIVEVYQ